MKKPLPLCALAAGTLFVAACGTANAGGYVSSDNAAPVYTYVPAPASPPPPPPGYVYQPVPAYGGCYPPPPHFHPYFHGGYGGHGGHFRGPAFGLQLGVGNFRFNFHH